LNATLEAVPHQLSLDHFGRPPHFSEAQQVDSLGKNKSKASF
jgi:hypothetical protein